jgi:hypothetical protein
MSAKSSPAEKRAAKDSPHEEGKKPASKKQRLQHESKDKSEIQYFYRVVIALDPGAMQMHEIFHLKNREEVEELIELLMGSEAAFDFLIYGLSFDVSIGNTSEPVVHMEDKGADMLLGLILKLSSRAKKGVTICPFDAERPPAPTLLHKFGCYTLKADDNWHCGHKGIWAKKHKGGLHCRETFMQNRGFHYIEYPEGYWDRLGGELPSPSIEESSDWYGHVSATIPEVMTFGSQWRNFRFYSAL